MTVWRNLLGRKAEVEVLRSDEPSLDFEKARAVGNFLYASNRGAVHADDKRVFTRTVKAIESAPPTVPLPWTACAIPVDADLRPFESIAFAHDFWVAVGQVSDCIVTVKGYGVPFEDVHLLTMADGAGSAYS